MSNIYAYTGPGCDYPEYISVNTAEAGLVSVSVRSRGNGGQIVAEIKLTPEEIERFAIAMTKHAAT